MRPFTPIFSHGGPSAPNWAPVLGNTTGPGRPVMIFPTVRVPAMTLAVTGSGGWVEVMIQASQGPVDPTTGVILDQYWVNAMPAVIRLAPDDNLGKDLPVSYAYYRSYVTATNGDATLLSCVGPIQTFNEVVAPSFPTYNNSPTEGL